MTTTTTRQRREDIERQITAISGRVRGGPWPLWVLLAELLGALALHGLHRGHAYISQADEAVHLVVAEHFLQHPLTPTLYEVGALSPNDARLWELDHIWLHIPPFGMWAAAIAMRVLGVTPFAARLPGLLFVLGGMVVVYVLGVRLFGPGVGLVGAAFAGFTPYALFMSQGYYFGDITDTPLIFLTPLVVLGIVLAYQSGRVRWLVLAGLALGLCYLDKGVLGLAPAGVLLALVVCERFFPQEAGWARLGWRGLVTFGASLAVVVLPYLVYVARAFPAQNAQEAQLWKANVLTSVEHWGRPPDYHLTIYLFALYGPALALLLVAAGTAVATVALRRRSRADLVLAVWLVAVYLPISVAVSKTVPLAYPAVPAVGLAVGRFAQLGLGSAETRRRVATLGLLLGTALAPIVLAGALAPYTVNYSALLSPSLAGPAAQSPLYRLVPYLEVLPLSALATGAVAAVLALARRAGADGARVARALPWVVVGLAVLALGAYWLGMEAPAVARIAHKVQPFEGTALGSELARAAPPNATLIAAQTDPIGFYHLAIMFWANRDIYVEPSLALGQVCVLRQRAAAAHSPFYVVAKPAELPVASGWRLHDAIADGEWGLYTPPCP